MVLKLPFSYGTVPSIRFGIGSIAESKNDIIVALGKRIMIVTDPGLTKLGLHLSVLNEIDVGDVLPIIFDEVESDPSLLTVFKAIAYAKENLITGIIGFGGGSSMDVAKLTALICGSKENLDRAWGVGNAKGPRLPLCLIPTTAGTGSEVTPISIITIEGEEKRGVVSPILLPDLAVLDPALTLGLPASITAATGVDAMVHAIEAFSSKSPNNNHLSRVMSKEALVLLNRSIRIATVSGKNIEARSDMLMGSMMAGMAFANSPVAAVHALAYPLGGTFHIPHGLSNALVLSEVLKFNSTDSKAAEAYTELAKIVCPSSKKNISNYSEALRFSQYFKELAMTLGLPLRLRDLNIPKKSLKKLACDAMQQTRLLINNPRPMNEADALNVYQSIW
ncbi:MAG: iron-containing alcohol dehydrogenase [Paracoccaceae bacterium]|nr:iron-containing alcohol dehydrogenase [Paracoccaceae bacterium]